MTVQNQDWTEYYSTNGRVLTVDFTRPAGMAGAWVTAYAIPPSSNYSFEVTDIQHYSFNASSELPNVISEWYRARIRRASGAITPVVLYSESSKNEWRRTGVVMQPGDQLEVLSPWQGPDSYCVMFNGNVTR